MRLVAEVVDKFSGPLKDMNKSLRELSRVAKGSHETGATAAREHAKAMRELAETIKRIPEPLMADLAALVEQLDVALVGDDVALALIDVGYCDDKYADATSFVSALRKRLQSYIDEPGAASATRAEFGERIAWWRLAVARAGELCRWPAIVLTEVSSGA
jgi:hypothetical protein